MEVSEEALCFRLIADMLGSEGAQVTHFIKRREVEWTCIAEFSRWSSVALLD